MITKVEGIILSKTPFQDRHIICRVLLRNGEKISGIFYGGQGGGKKKKSSFLEVGYVIRMEISRAKKNAQIFSIKEWSLVWHHDEIRKNHKAFYQLCFFLELSDKLIVEADLFGGNYENELEKDSMFKVLSNAIFFLEKRCLTKDVDFNTDLFMFISKVLIQEGIFPERNHCVLSGEDLRDVETMVLLDEQGGFADSTCVNIDMLDPRINIYSAKELWNFLCKVGVSKYSSINDFNNISKEYSNRLIDYLFFQVGFDRNEFKSLSLIF